MGGFQIKLKIKNPTRGAYWQSAWNDMIYKFMNYALAESKRFCNVKTGALRASLGAERTETGIVMYSDVTDPRNGYPYAGAVHQGHGGPIPYEGNPFFIRGLKSAAKRVFKR